MARPQLENGHTRIANELMDAFCKAFPGGSEAQILLAIIRKTYGWRKKSDEVSISQLEDMTFLGRRTVILAVQNLEAKRMITVHRRRGRGNVNQVNSIALQKNYDLWVVQRKSSQYEKQLQNQRLKYQDGVVQRTRGSAKNGQKVVQRNAKKGQFFAPTKEIKKIQKKEERSSKKETFKEYTSSLREEFTDINFDLELRKFNLYWSDGNRKLKNPKLALFNWMTKCREFAKSKKVGADGWPT